MILIVSHCSMVAVYTAMKYGCNKKETILDLQKLLLIAEWSLYGVILTLLLLNRSCLVLANSVDPDQLASEEAN